MGCIALLIAEKSATRVPQCIGEVGKACALPRPARQFVRFHSLFTSRTRGLLLKSCRQLRSNVCVKTRGGVVFELVGRLFSTWTL